MHVSHVPQEHTQGLQLLLRQQHVQSVLLASSQKHGGHLPTALAWHAQQELLQKRQVPIRALHASLVRKDPMQVTMAAKDVCCARLDMQQACLKTHKFIKIIKHFVKSS